MWLIVVEVEQETSAPPPKKNPGSAPVGVGIYQPQGHPQAFDMHMVSYLNITLTTQKILLKYKQIGYLSRIGKTKKIKRKDYMYENL